MDGVGFVTADLSKVVAGFGRNAGGELSAQLQGFASIGRAFALFPSLAAPAFGLEILFGQVLHFGGDGTHHGAGVGGVFEQLAETVFQLACI